MPFNCEKCKNDFLNKRDYDRHLRSLTHRINSGEEIDISKLYKCSNCKEYYGSRTTLWRHKKKCNIANNSMELETEKENSIEDKELQTYKELMFSMVNETKKLRKEFVRQSEMLQEKSIGTVNITNVINSNSKNVNFNLFLDKECSNAVNLSDFVETLDVRIEDLERTKEIGYVRGISDIILRSMKQLDIYRRPIHYTGPVKEAIYVRHDNKWANDICETQPMVKSAISAVAKKQLDKVADWEHENVEWIKSEQGTDAYMNLVKQATSGCDINDEQILQNIVKEVKIKPGQLLIGNH